MSAREFVANPQPGIAQRFAESQQAAIDSLKTIQDLAGEAERQNLSALSGRVANLKTTFASLTAEQDNLGLSEFEGFQGDLRDTGAAMERIVNDEMTWLSEAEQRKILVPLMLARRYEVEFRATRSDPTRSLFNDEIARFEKAFAAIGGGPAQKRGLIDQGKAHTKAVGEWSASREKNARANTIISPQ